MFVTICSTSSKANGYKFSEIHTSSDSLQVTAAQPKTELASVCVVPTSSDTLQVTVTQPKTELASVCVVSSSEFCSVIGTKIKKTTIRPFPTNLCRSCRFSRAIGG